MENSQRVKQGIPFILKSILFFSLVSTPFAFSRACAEKTVTVRPKNSSFKSVAASKKATAGSPNQVARGKKLFERLTCAGCHPNGENTLHPYRPLKGSGFLSRYKEDKQIELLIRTGVARAGMPAFSKIQISDNDMKDLISFVRSLTPKTKK